MLLILVRCKLFYLYDHVFAGDVCLMVCIKTHNDHSIQQKQKEDLFRSHLQFLCILCHLKPVNNPLYVTIHSG